MTTRSNERGARPIGGLNTGARDSLLDLVQTAPSQHSLLLVPLVLNVDERNVEELRILESSHNLTAQVRGSRGDVRLKVMRARTVLCLALSSHRPASARSFEPSPCGRFYVVGDAAAVTDAIADWHQQVLAPMQEQLPGFLDKIPEAVTSGSKCRGFLPMPAHGIAWSRFKGWAALIASTEDDGRAQAAKLQHWLDKSYAWLTGDDTGLLQRLRKNLGYDIMTAKSSGGLSGSDTPATHFDL